MMASRSAVTMRMETVLLASMPINGYRGSDILLLNTNTDLYNRATPLRQQILKKEHTSPSAMSLADRYILYLQPNSFYIY